MKIRVSKICLLLDIYFISFSKHVRITKRNINYNATIAYECWQTYDNSLKVYHVSQ